MLRKKSNFPLDYSMCCMTVTMYHREGLTRQVIRNAHLEYTRQTEMAGGVETPRPSFLLVVPGALDIEPGDKVMAGEGPAITQWQTLQALVVESVKPRYFMGRLCHTEVRG